MTEQLIRLYRKARRHQMATYGNSGLHDCNGRNVRQFTGGGAWYGEHALAAFNSARSHIHFLRTMRRTGSKRK